MSYMSNHDDGYHNDGYHNDGYYNDGYHNDGYHNDGYEGYELLYGNGYSSDPDDYKTSPDEMQEQCESLLEKATLMDDDDPLKKPVLNCLSSIYRRIVGPKCADCGGVDCHYYSCVHAEKCVSCGVRTDTGRQDHREHCKTHGQDTEMETTDQSMSNTPTTATAVTTDTAAVGRGSNKSKCSDCGLVDYHRYNCIHAKQCIECGVRTDNDLVLHVGCSLYTLAKPPVKPAGSTAVKAAVPTLDEYNFPPL